MPIVEQSVVYLEIFPFPHDDFFCVRLRDRDTSLRDRSLALLQMKGSDGLSDSMIDTPRTLVTAKVKRYARERRYNGRKAGIVTKREKRQRRDTNRGEREEKGGIEREKTLHGVHTSMLK